MKKVVLKQNPDELIPTEILAESIVAISEGIRKLRQGRLNDRALFLLIQAAAPNVGGKYSHLPISIKEIKAVFEGIDALESMFLKKPTK